MKGPIDCSYDEYDEAEVTTARTLLDWLKREHDCGRGDRRNFAEWVVAFPHLGQERIESILSELVVAEKLIIEVGPFGEYYCLPPFRPSHRPRLR